MIELREKLEELAARKRAELEAALERGKVHDPITGAIAFFAIWHPILFSAAVSVAVSAASYALSRAFAPKPAKQEFGRLQGTLQLQNSEQGIMIPEIYGGSPSADKTLGGIKVPAIIVWSSGIRKHVSVTQQPRQGGKGGGGSQPGAGTVENISYDIDLGLMFCKGPVNLLRLYANADTLVDQTAANPTGIYDPTIGADPTYDPYIPPDPTYDYSAPIDRHNYALAVDGDGVGTGTIQSGAASYAQYPGNEDQTPDPTIEAAVDAIYGSGSTPAYKGHSLIVETEFDLSRWGGIVPNHTAVFEHQTLLTLDDIYASLCERVNVTDYDFSGLSAIDCRGMLIAGRLFSPAEVIGSPGIQTVYNYFVTETEGEIVGLVEGSEPTVTIADTEIGWSDGDDDVGDILPEVDTVIASEIELARQVDIKYLQLGAGDWDPNTQSDNRQITEGESTQVLEVQIALTEDEARTAAQRKLYRDYVAGSVHKFTLPWTYLYLYPGYEIVVTRAEGFTHTLKLTSITGGIGILECEGVALEPAAFTQPAHGSIGPGYQPPQSIPAMTILTLLDTPLLKDGDETNNNAIGFYMCGTPRTGVDQSWNGFVLYVEHTDTWMPLANSNLPGTIGRIVAVTVLLDDPDTIDTTGVITVDLYGSATLASVTDAQMLDGENRALAGDMIFGFATATQAPGYPNRWELSRLLNGQRDTEEFIGSAFVGKRFVLIDEAVKFVPFRLEDLDNNLNYRAVSVGQSFEDTATVSFAWSGNTLRPGKPSDVVISLDGNSDALIQFIGHPSPLDPLNPTYAVEIWSSEDRTNEANRKRIIPVTTGTTHACMLDSTGTAVYDDVTYELATYITSTHSDKNNLLSGGLLVEGQTLEALESTFTRYDFTFRVNDDSLTTTSGVFALATLEEDAAFNTSNRSPDVSSASVSIQWQGDGGAGTTIVEQIKSFNVNVGTARTFDWDADGLSIRYTFLLSGTEFRVYADYVPGRGDAPLAIISSPGTGYPFPMRLKMGLIDNSVGGFFIDNIVSAGNLEPSTIYANRDQVEDFGATQSVFFLRLYQYSRFGAIDHGIPLDVIVFPPALLLEDATELFTESSDTILR